MTASASSASSAAKPIQLVAWPEAECEFQSSTGPVADHPFYADDLGIVAFATRQATAGDPTTALTLACHDETGRAGTYAVDLTAGATFESANAVALRAAAPMTRPALTGDPMSYTVDDLLARGYGLRPDANKAPASYARWLQGASVPAREVRTKDRPTRFSFGNKTSDLWSGGELNGSAGTTWLATNAYFVVPTSRDSTCGSSAALWSGLGGDNAGGDALIQAGVEIQTFTVDQILITDYFTWKQQAGGPPNSGSCYDTSCFLFYTGASDHILQQGWSCTSTGAESTSGGYACFYIDDLTTNAYKVCSTPTSSCPSLKVNVPFEGATAEAIVENTGNVGSGGCLSEFNNFGEAEIYLDAYTAQAPSTDQNYTTVSNTTYTVVDNAGHALDGVAIDAPSPDGTTFLWERGM